MVHVATPRPSIGSSLGNALGGIAGQFVGRNEANKAEQMRYERDFQRQQQQQYLQQSMLHKALNEAQNVYANPNLSPEEKQIGLYKALSHRPEVAAALGKQLGGFQKNAQTQGMINSIFSGGQQEGANQQQPPVGQQNTPVGQPQENISPSVEQKPFDPASLSDEQIARLSAWDPNVGRTLQAQKQAAVKQQNKEKELKRKEDLEFHKESSKFDEKLSSDSDAAEKKLKAIHQQRKIQPKITKWDRFVSAIFKGSPVENLLKSKDAQEFDSYALPMIEGNKDTFGVRLSDADLRLILQKIATSDKNPEANDAIADWYETEERLKIDRRKIADEIRKENKGLRPLDYEAKIRQKMSEKYGNEIDEKAKKILSLTDNPQKLQEITGRTKVAPGTTLTPDIASKYLEMSGKNRKLAEQMAREDGYQF